MRLQAQPPARAGEAVCERLLRVPLHQRPVHRLKKEVLEGERLETLRLRACLGEDELELVSGTETERGAGLGAHADPVEPGWGILGPVGLDGDLEAAGLERGDRRSVELEQRLAAGADHVRPCAGALGPRGPYRGGERLGIREPGTAVAVDADEVGVAEAADGARAVLLAPRPEVAAREPAEDGRAARLGAFPLQRVEDLLDRIGHSGKSNGITFRPMPSQRRAVVLLSGGMDSAASGAIARAEGFEVNALTIRYGQRHAVEVDAARAVARRLGAARHVELAIDLRAIGGSALTDDIVVPLDRGEAEIGRGIPAT